jgi:hypothetical protein
VADELIELIESDPGAFGRSPGGGASNPSPFSPASASRRRLLAGFLAVAAGGVTYAVFDDPPWADSGPQRTFRDDHPTTSVLSQQLLLDVPVNQVRATTLHTQALPAANNLLASGAVGYFFGEAGATFDTGDGKDRWLGFYAMPSAASGAPQVGKQTDSIAGAPAALQTADNGLTQVVWGPVEGSMFTAAAANLSRNEIVSLGEQLRVRKDSVVVLNKAGLGTLRPIGRFSDYWTLVNLVQRAQQNGVHLEGVVGVFYNTGASITSMPANRSAIAMVAFVLGTKANAPESRTVHGAPAVAFEKGKGAFNGLPATTVMWWEGGRLVQVSGEGTVDDVAKLAASAHVASATDWSAVQGVQ